MLTYLLVSLNSVAIGKIMHDNAKFMENCGSLPPICSFLNCEDTFDLACRHNTRFGDCDIVCPHGGEPTHKGIRCVVRKKGGSYWKKLPSKGNLKTNDMIGCMGAMAPRTEATTTTTTTTTTTRERFAFCGVTSWVARYKLEDLTDDTFFDSFDLVEVGSRERNRYMRLRCRGGGSSRNVKCKDGNRLRGLTTKKIAAMNCV